ncbi:MAG: oxidoreductase [Frondihabitans sp.]|nr:oxidoreductase [Frondihabitans sp.]
MTNTLGSRTTKRLPHAPAPSIQTARRTRRRDHQRRSAAVDALGILVWFSVAVAVALYLASPGAHILTSFAAIVTAFGIIAGLIATDLVLVMIVLAARVPLVDRVFGTDRAIAVHRSLGKPVLYLILVHASLVTIGYGLADRTNPVGETISLFTTLHNMPLAYLALGLFIAVVVTSVVTVRRRLPYEAWHVIHLLSYAAVAVALPHQLSVGTVMGSGTWQRVYWILLYVFALGAIAVYRFIMPTVVTFRHRIRVIDVVPIAPGVVSIHLSGRDLTRLGVQGGQYGVWRFWTAKTWWHAHPVSFSAVPDEDRARITVRALGAGSRRLGGIRPGAFVSLEGPYGLFTAKARTAPYLTLIASGIGITPIRSLLEDSHLRPHEAAILLRGSDPDQRYLWNEVAALARDTKSEIFGMIGPRPAHGDAWQSAEDWNRGVTLASTFPHLLESDLYVCGPQAWTDLVVRDARIAGVPEHQIHQERFNA